MMSTCRVIRPGSAYDGKQGLSYFEGIARETVGSSGLCMHLLTIPPGARAKAHLHESHETAIYVLSGEAHTWYGDRLQEHAVVRAGEMFYIPAGVPHGWVPSGAAGAAPAGLPAPVPPAVPARLHGSCPGCGNAAP